MGVLASLKSFACLDFWFVFVFLLGLFGGKANRSLTFQPVGLSQFEWAFTGQQEVIGSTHEEKGVMVSTLEAPLRCVFWGCLSVKTWLSSCKVVKPRHLQKIARLTMKLVSKTTSSDSTSP